MPDCHTLEIYNWERNCIDIERIAHTAAKLPPFLSAWCTTHTLELWVTADDIPDKATENLQHLAAELFAIIHRNEEEF